MTRLFLFLSLLLLPAWASAQLRGVVWTRPASPTEAAAELRRMHEMGVEAVRTGPVRDAALYTLADSLGIQLFQELPLSHLPAPRLLDSLDYAKGLVRELLVRSRNHPSARHFGLARHVDTTAPQAAEFFRELTGLVHSERPDARTYYVTSFVESDQSAAAVDLVLLDLLDTEQPGRTVDAWRQQHETPVGVAQVGTWVRDAAGPGYRVPHAPEAQARLVETALWDLLYETLPPPEVVFVYQWRTDPTTARLLDNPFERDYGFFTPEGAPRPVLSVVEGFYTDRQQVFAFPPGEEPGSTPSSMLVLFGWLLVLALLGLYFASAKFRKLLRRYFTAHSFYREEVRNGRDLPALPALVMFAVLALCGGVAWTVFLRTIYLTDTFATFLNWMPEIQRDFFVTLLYQPWLSILLVAAVYAVLWVLQVVAVALVGRYRRVHVGQALTLVLWPHWTLLLLMIAALIVGTLPPEWRGQGGLVLFAALFAATLYGIVRSQRDFITTFRIALVRGYLIGLGVPTAVIVFLFISFVLPNLPEVDYLWHLALRD